MFLCWTCYCWPLGNQRHIQTRRPRAAARSPPRAARGAGRLGRAAQLPQFIGAASGADRGRRPRVLTLGRPLDSRLRVQLSALMSQEISERNTKLLKDLWPLDSFFVFSIDTFHLIPKINPVSNKCNYPPRQKNPITTGYWPLDHVVSETTYLEMLLAS